MSTADNAGRSGVLAWPPAAVASPPAVDDRIGRHGLATRAALTWHRAFYTARHRRR